MFSLATSLLQCGTIERLVLLNLSIAIINPLGVITDQQVPGSSLIHMSHYSIVLALTIGLTVMFMKTCSSLDVIRRL